MTKGTVLIVEDEAIVAADLSAKLSLLGYEVVAVTARGDEAVRLACDLLPMIVLMDIRLKGPMDGIQAARAIRERVDLPIIYLTAHSDTATLNRAKSSEPSGYILKPFEEKGVATAIELALYKHEADRRVREQREWLRITLASIGDAVITCDSEGRTTYLNPVAETVTGWSLAEAMDQPIEKIFPLIDEETREPVEHPVAYVLRERRTKILMNHTVLVSKDGREIPIEDSAAPIMDDNGRLIGTVLVFHDVSERRRAQIELQQANLALAAANEELRAQTGELQRAREAADSATRAKSQFLANMSHELRTPMTGVLGMLELALGTPLNQEQQEYLQTAFKAGSSLLRILNDILDLSRVETGKLSLENSPFDIRTSVRDTVDLMLPEARRKGLSLTLRLAEPLPPLVVADEVRLRQVLTNLTANALKFTETGGVEIAVASSARQHGDEILLRFIVRDTGIGIPTEKKDLLFKFFSQVDDSDTRSYGGAGLGLAISRGIVEGMGGSISFESEAGKGSSFTFTVPSRLCTEGSPAAVAEEAAPAPGPRPREEQGPVRVLVAEDDPVVRQVLGNLFRCVGFDTWFAEDGEKAVALWREQDWDVIVMDIQMPKLDGFAATRAIREMEREKAGAAVPIIAMTAHTMKEDRSRCLDAGMDRFLSKPIDFKECVATIEEVVAGARKQR